MTEETFDILKEKSTGFEYTSFTYLDYEDVKDYEILFSDERLIMLYGYNNESKVHEYCWACNKLEDMLTALGERKGKISFVPEEWVEGLKESGFEIFAIWNDYFKDDMDYPDNLPEPQFLKPEECDGASQVTLSCRYQSRGFTGQTSEWISKWMRGKEPDYTRDNAVIVHKIDGRIAGIIFTCTYGHESAKGPIAWVREVAVDPDFQNRGIGRLLINQAIAYGKEHGATRAFLAADECNANGIHLYESLGFTCKKEEREINMIRE